MILTGTEIALQVAAGKVRISPFTEDAITTNSYDLRLGETFIRYNEDTLDVARPNSFETIGPVEEIVLQRGDFALGHSCEQIGSDHFVPIIHAKSSTARLGLFVHVTADLIDIGSYGQVTFQLFATEKIRLVPGMSIAQVTFWVPRGEIKLYDGKYQASNGPRPSEAFRDFLGRDS